MEKPKNKCPKCGSKILSCIKRVVGKPDRVNMAWCIKPNCTWFEIGYTMGRKK